VAAALGAFAPAALAQEALPDARTHVDPAEGTAVPAGTADPDAPRLTLLKSDTDAADVRRGYLYVIARCDARCVVDVSATTKISGKQREVATVTKNLPANKTRRIKLKIRSDVRRRLAAGARFSFTAVPLPPFDG
jgi:hypothetical protein